MDNWQWHPDKQLYYSPDKQLWAKWDAGASAWEFAEPVRSAATSGAGTPGGNARDELASDDREPGELSDVEMEDPVDEDEYNPEYDWPGLEDESDPPKAGESAYAARRRSSHRSPPFHLRLVVSSSSVLRSNQTVAVFRPSEGVSIGRDSAPGSRLRLKEMAVSKFHANIFWDYDLEEWAIVDVGSMHGTFIQSFSSGITLRLSPSRVASPPRALRHFDGLTIGSTAFVVHAHRDGMPCNGCLITDDNEISLSEKKKASKADEPAVASPSPLTSTERKAALRKDMSSLKRALLSRGASAPVDASSRAQYVDRSARRRRFHPDSEAVTPIRAASPNPTTPDPTPSSTPPVLPPSNIGHILLQKQGWKPGMTLGTPESDALSEPLAPLSTSGRRGLGMKGPGQDETQVNTGDWREEGKRKRYDTIR